MQSNVFEFFYRTGTHTQVEDGNFRLNKRLLEHCSVASPPTNQNKITHAAALTPNVTFCFWGHDDDHLFRPPVWPYFISDRGQQFQAKLLLLQG